MLMLMLRQRMGLVGLLAVATCAVIASVHASVGGDDAAVIEMQDDAALIPEAMPDAQLGCGEWFRPLSPLLVVR